MEICGEHEHGAINVASLILCIPALRSHFSPILLAGSSLSLEKCEAASDIHFVTLYFGKSSHTHHRDDHHDHDAKKS